MYPFLSAIQPSDPYDGVLPLLEARVERTRVQEAESEAMKALETDPELATAQTTTPIEPTEAFKALPVQLRQTMKLTPGSTFTHFHYGDGEVLDTGKRHCQDCATGLIRIIRNSDDTVRHVNGEKCKRFHS